MGDDEDSDGVFFSVLGCSASFCLVFPRLIHLPLMEGLIHDKAGLSVNAA
jgi:hypothetical protein